MIKKIIKPNYMFIDRIMISKEGGVLLSVSWKFLFLNENL